jgi:hypothetical protein
VNYKDIDLGKGYNPWGEHRPPKPPETVNAVSDEVRLLKLVAEHQPIQSWELFMLAEPQQGLFGRARRHKLMVISTRLIREGKLQRARSHLTLNDAGFKTRSPGVRNCLVLGPSYVPFMPDIQDASSEDLSRLLRDVDSLSGVP